jgi:hypothetical protein
VNPTLKSTDLIIGSGARGWSYPSTSDHYWERWAGHVPSRSLFRA